MANYKSIEVVGQAIVRILADGSRNEFPSAEFRWVRAIDLATLKKHPKEGASVCLYHVGINSERRNAPPSRDPAARLVHPPTLLTLRFLITPWGRNAKRHARLMGWTIRTMESTPILSATFLNGIVSNEAVFSADESVELVYDPLSLSDLSIVLQNLKLPNALPSITYAASLVLGE